MAKRGKVRIHGPENFNDWEWDDPSAHHRSCVVGARTVLNQLRNGYFSIGIYKNGRVKVCLSGLAYGERFIFGELEFEGPDRYDPGEVDQMVKALRQFADEIEREYAAHLKRKEDSLRPPSKEEMEAQEERWARTVEKTRLANLRY